MPNSAASSFNEIRMLSMLSTVSGKLNLARRLTCLG